MNFGVVSRLLPGRAKGICTDPMFIGARRDSAMSPVKPDPLGPIGNELGIRAFLKDDVSSFPRLVIDQASINCRESLPTSEIRAITTPNALVHSPSWTLISNRYAIHALGHSRSASDIRPPTVIAAFLLEIESQDGE